MYNWLVPEPLVKVKSNDVGTGILVPRRILVFLLYSSRISDLIPLP